MRERHFLPAACVLFLSAASLSAQATWTGAASNSWDNPFNWDTGLVPDASTDVTIASAPNQPSSFIFAPVCDSLTIEAAASLDLVAGFDLTVNGDLVIDGTLAVASSSSDLLVAGGWTNNGTFTNGGAAVELSGTGVLDGTSTSVFQDLTLSGGTRTGSVDFTVDGDVSVDAGATLTLNSTATVRGNWSSSAAGAGTNGTGVIAFDGTGLLTTGLNGLPAVTVVSGTRSVNPSTISGDLAMTGGTLQILDNATLIVGGNAALSGGTLTFQNLFAGTENLDVAGNATVTCTAGTFSADTRILCAGDWSSSAAFHPTAGSVELDGVGTRTMSGAGMALFNLRVASGTVNATSATQVDGSLLVDSGATLDADAVFTIGTSVILGGIVGGWDLGGLEHTVSGEWTSAGHDATNGTIRFTAAGQISTGGAGIDNVILAGGLYTTGNLAVLSDITIDTGELRIENGATVAVAGNALLNGGTLGFDDTSAAVEVFDVEGNVSASGTLAGAIGASSEIHCAGNWTSNGTFVPTDGTVLLDGAAAAVNGVTAHFHRLRIASGTRTIDVGTALTADLRIDDGATLESNDLVTVATFASLGDATATWNLGGGSAVVGTDLLGTGGSLTNGTLTLDGAGGAVDLGGGTADVIQILSGARTMADLGLASLEVTGGTLAVDPAALVAMTGDMTISGGTVSLGAGTTVTVAGNTDVTGGTAGAIDGSARIEFAGDWTANATWVPADGTTAFTGVLATVSGDARFSDLDVDTGVLQASAPLTISGDLNVEGNLTTNTPSAIAGRVDLGATATWDLGVQTHTLVGTYRSIGGSTVNGTLELSGTGDLEFGGGSVDTVAVTGGTRRAKTGTLTGQLFVSGGTFRIDNDATVTVNGNATFTGGTVGWFPAASGPDETLLVEGNVDCSATVGFEAAGSRFVCRGNWTSSAAFVPTAAAIVLDGTSSTTVGGAPDLFFLICSNATRTLTSPLDVRGNLVLQTGAGIDATAGVLDVDGNTTLTPGTTIDLGALDHTFAGDLLADDATISGTGTVVLDGTGTLSTGAGGSISNARITTGTRTAQTSVIADTLQMTGGTLEIADDQILTVDNLAQLSAGTLSFAAAGGGLETLDAVNVEIDATAGTMDADSVILCSGSWTSSNAWAPTAGTVFLDGGGIGSVAGASPTFRDLVVLAGDKTVSTATTVQGDLTVFGGQTLNTLAAMTVQGNASLLSGATMNPGALTHTIGGDWTSSGSTVNDTAVFEFTGDGVLDTGADTIPNALISGGTREVSTSAIQFNLQLTGGTLSLSDNQTLTVQQNAELTGGTLAFVDSTAGAETLDVQGDMVSLASTSGTTSSSALILCGGNWSSDSTWAPAAGLVRLDSGAIVLLTGANPAFANLEIASGDVTALPDVSISGDLDLLSGATLTSDLAFTVGGNVTLGDATSAWDVGGSTHGVSGDWTSAGGTASGSGEISFAAGGTIDTAGGGMPNVRALAGTRTIDRAEINGNLIVDGGTLEIGDDALAHVTDDFTMTAGTLSWTIVGAPGQDVLDVDGNVSITGLAGGSTVDSLLRCGGDWLSGGGFALPQGTVMFDGTGPATVGGTALTLPNVEIASGSRTLLDPAALSSLTIDNGSDLTTLGAMDVTGPVSLGDATASLNLGSLTHEVLGDFLSAGANTVNGGIDFDGTGTLSTGAASVPNIGVSLGTRTLQTSTVSGNLTQTGGAVVIDVDAAISVAGSADLSVGTITWPAAADGTPDVLDVEGNVVATVTVLDSSTDATFRCAGDWSSDSSFDMTQGFVVLDGTSTTSLTGLAPGADPTFPRLVLSGGERTVANDINLIADTVEIGSAAQLTLDAVKVDLAQGLLSVDGTVAVGAGGDLSLGAPVIALIAPSGTLSLLGDFGDPASVTGHAGGGYDLTIDGTLNALNFRVERMGAGGVVVTPSATVTSMQAGAFAFPSATPGSVMLDIRRSSPESYYYVDFEDANGDGTNNVQTLGGAAIAFIDSEGELSGDAFEIDLLDIVEWTSEPTTLSSFTATPGIDQVTVNWISTLEVNTDEWLLLRATSAGGPFTEIDAQPAAGPSSYVFVDAAVAAGTTYFYRLDERKLHGEVASLATDDATPWTNSLPGNIFTVGATGAFADIQSAVNAVGGINPVVRIEAGTYSAFTVNAGKGALRIYADGSGPVVINTTSGPVTIDSITVFDSVEIRGLEIGSKGSPNSGVLITGCDGLVVLDECMVEGGNALPGIDVVTSDRVAIQRCDVSGDPGLAVNGSALVAGRGALDSIDLSNASDVRLAELSPTDTVDGTSVLEILPGVHADLTAPGFASLGTTFDLTYDGTPGGIYVTAYSTGLGWFDLGGSFEMQALINILTAPQLSTGILAAGPVTQTLPVPGDGALYGAVVPLQMVVVNPVTLTFRFSNVASMALTN